jgi:hypothetical protein
MTRTGDEGPMSDRHATVTGENEGAASRETTPVNPDSRGVSPVPASARGRNRTFNLAPSSSLGARDFAGSTVTSEANSPAAARQGPETPSSVRHGTVIVLAAALLMAACVDDRPDPVLGALPGRTSPYTTDRVYVAGVDSARGVVCYVSAGGSAISCLRMAAGPAEAVRP